MEENKMEKLNIIDLDIRMFSLLIYGFFFLYQVLYKYPGYIKLHTYN